MKKIIKVLFFKLIVTNILAQPNISSFNPISGRVGTTVIISGSNFNPTLANNIVYFGETKATLISGSTTSLTVSVPIGASYHPISVTNLTTGLTAFSSQPFNVTFPCGGSYDFQTNVLWDGGGVNYQAFNGTGTFPVDIVTGDLDGDGKVDVVNLLRGSIYVHRNTSTIGEISFASPLELSGGYEATISDFDRDGKLDLACKLNNDISVFRNTSTIGSISFDSPYYIIIGGNSSGIGGIGGISTGDYNGDGKPDLSVTNYTSNTISILSNTGSTGTISFAPKIDFSTRSIPTKIATGDFNYDGKQDLAVTYGGTDHTVSVFKNITTVGPINFAPMLNFTTGGGAGNYGILIGDLDGDKKSDIVGLCGTTLSILRNNSTSTSISFDSTKDFTFDGVTGSIGDLDGDNKPDIATTAISHMNFQKNTSSPGFISFQSTDINQLNNSKRYSDGISINDFDCDGKADLGYIDLKIQNNLNTIATFKVIRNKQFCPATTITSFSPTSGPIGTTVIIKGTNFNPTPSNNLVLFGATRATVISGSTTSLTISVPVGESNQPISVTNLSTELIAYSSKPFNVTFRCGDVINQTSLTPKVDFAAGINPFSIATGDVDNDGKTDLAVVNVGSNTVSVYRNIGHGGIISYAPKVDYITGSQPYSISLADYNGDGKLDLAVANLYSATVSIFMNSSTNGTIIFYPKIDFVTNIGPSNIVSNDFDGDGKTDLAIANVQSTNISILRNNGGLGIISFEPKVDFTIGTTPYVLSAGDFVLTAGDFDGDNKVDIAVVKYNSNSFSIYRNTCISGTISFAPKVDFITGTQPRGITIGDIDMDGKPDVAITNYGSNTLSIFRNLSNIGAISFASKVDIATGTQPYSISIADLDGDNKLDATLVNFGGNSISVLKNTSYSGSVSFAPKVDYTTGAKPRGFAITDFDGDGKLDISVVNSNSNTISFFRNLVSGIIPNVTANSSSGNSICAGVNIILTGGGADTYTWTGGITEGVSFIPPNGKTTYTVTGTVNSSGCSNTDTISIISGPNININSSATSICTGESITLTAGGADSYSWNNGVTNSVSFIPPIGTTTYTVFGTNTTTGCQNSDSVQIIVNSLPLVYAGTDQTICQGHTVTLSAAGANTYVWNNNVINNVAFSPTSNNNYIVNGTDVNGCHNSDTVHVTVNPTSTSQLTQTVVGHYTLNGQTYTQSGTYKQVIPNALGCDSTITLNLTINTTGLNELTKTKFAIYPNPANNLINIEYEGNIKKLEIIDAKGVVVFVSKENLKEYLLPTYLQSGYYIVNIYTDSQFTIRKELLIQR
jgi:hypothetical protein